jgi:hypothetical protein
MSDTPQCTAIGLTDLDIIGMVRCARHRLVVIAPGLSEDVARAIADVWIQIGADKVQVVLDPDPEVCRMGFGEMSALKLLHDTAEQLGARIQQQQGLRIGVIITDETTAIYSPTPLLVEAGAKPGEKMNAIRMEAPIASSGKSGLSELNLDQKPVNASDVRQTEENLKANPPVKFDIARKVRVFNARIEFVEFELRGLQLSRMTAKIPSYLITLLQNPEVRDQFSGSYRLIQPADAEAADAVSRMKQDIAEGYLITLTGHGAVIRREMKEAFLGEVKKLETAVEKLKESALVGLQKAIDRNCNMLTDELLPGIIQTPPAEWQSRIGLFPQPAHLERMLRLQLNKAFGNAEKLCSEMEVRTVFKGVTYESLNDPEFIALASDKIPTLAALHDEFDAAKAEGQLKP